MKKNLFVVIVSIISIQIFAQRPEIPRELSSLLNVPFLEHGYSGYETPGGELRFDKFILINSNTSDGKPVDIFLYINTTTGAFATRTEKRDKLISEQFDIESKDFKLTYFSPKGKVIQFYNRLKNGVVERKYSAMNTEIVAFSMPSMENTWVFKQSGSTRSLPQNFQTGYYKATTPGAPLLFLCGDLSQPKMKATKFVGYSGIGYVKTDKGIYMVAGVVPEGGGNAFSAEKWKDINEHFNLIEFKSAEGEVYDKLGAEIDKELNKPHDIKEGACQSIEHEISVAKKLKAQNMQNLVQKTTRGNMINDKNVQNAMAAMQDPTADYGISQLEIELRICKLVDRMNRQSVTELDKKKMDCLETELANNAAATAEAEAIDRQFGADKINALPKKREIWKKYSHKRTKECMKVL